MSHCVDCARDLVMSKGPEKPYVFYSNGYYKKYHEAEDKQFGSTTENPHGRLRAGPKIKVIAIDEAHKVDNMAIAFLSVPKIMLGNEDQKKVVNKIVNCTKPVETEKDMENWLGAALTHLGNIDKDYDEANIQNYAHANVSWLGKGLIISINDRKFSLNIVQIPKGMI